LRSVSTRLVAWLSAGVLASACGPAAIADGDGQTDGGGSVADAPSVDAAGRADATPRVDADTDGQLPPECDSLAVTYRDFRPDHDDFEEVEAKMGSDRGIVAAMLGAGRKPVYAHTGATRTVTSPMSFASWYTTDPNVNVEIADRLRLTEDPPGSGRFVFDDSDFFPIDGRGFETGSTSNNFHFTSEVHAEFRYRGGELFTFRGDDDVFVFVNDRLALDLGGVHTPEAGTIDFDGQAAALGLVVGEYYPLDIFHAERHMVQSNFRIETTIDCFGPID
jgi:fibro-slime domain-containing protein